MEEWTNVLHREMASLQQQLTPLTDILLGICRVVAPSPTNLDVFGHEIRNLLILACTEVETQCRGVLKANGYAITKPTRTDYRKLADAMRLVGYQIGLSRFANVTAVRPFAGWAKSGLTEPIVAKYT